MLLQQGMRARWTSRKLMRLMDSVAPRGEPKPDALVVHYRRRASIRQQHDHDVRVPAWLVDLDARKPRPTASGSVARATTERPRREHGRPRNRGDRRDDHALGEAHAGRVQHLPRESLARAVMERLDVKLVRHAEVVAMPRVAASGSDAQRVTSAGSTQKPPSETRVSAERTGLEPAASGVTGRRYNRLNYRSSAPKSRLLRFRFPEGFR